VSRPGSLTWFAGHELRLAWRDWFSMMTAGRKSRRRSVFVWVGLFVLFLHWIAFAFVGPFAHVAPNPGKPALIVVTASLLLSFSMMLSQAMESVTRAFYSRSDLDLILVSPARADRLFAVRIGAIALLAVGMSALVMGPFINMLALAGGVRWLAAYGVIVSLALTATAFSVALTYALFRLIGAKRTRLAAQIVAAILGATFVIGLQVAAILSSGTASRSCSRMPLRLSRRKRQACYGGRRGRRWATSRHWLQCSPRVLPCSSQQHSIFHHGSQIARFLRLAQRKTGRATPRVHPRRSRFPRQPARCGARSGCCFSATLG